MNQDFIEKAKKHFEANMLDGEDVFDCGKAMLSAESVWEYLKSALKEAMEERNREIIEFAKSQKCNVVNAIMNLEREAENRTWNKLIKFLTPPSTKE